MKSKVLHRIKVGENRELRITQINTEIGQLLRISTYLTTTPPKALSGTTFPPEALTELIAALQQTKRGLK